MARLPQLIAEGRLPARAPAVGIERPDLVAPAGRALTGFGNALESAGLTAANVEKNARDTRDVIAGTATAADELDKYRIELESDPDYAGREAKFQQRAQQVKARLAEPMSGAAQLDFEKSFERSYQILAHGLRDKARKDEIEESFVKLDESNNKLLDVALRERDPRKRAMHLETIAQNIEDARQANILTKPQADKVHKATLEKFERLQVTEYARTNPGLALRMLTAEPDKGGLTYMDPLDKKKMALDIQREQSRKAQLNEIIARGTVGQAIELYDHGIKPEQGDRARELAKSYPDLAARLDTAEGNYFAAAQFRGMDQGERRQATAAILDKENTVGLTNPEAQLLSRYVKIDREIKDGFAKDRMGAAMERNGPAAQALADAERAGDVEGFRAAVKSLVDTQVKEGVRPDATAMLPKRVEQATEALLTGAANQGQADTIQRLQHFYGPELMPRVMAQLDEGKKIPGFVRVIASLGPKAAGDPDIKRMIEAAKVPEGDWAKLIPEETVRKDIKLQVGAEGERIRAAFMRVPGGPQRYSDYARLAEDVAMSLVADKTASAGQAPKLAWSIVHDRHFALAGTVVIPKVDGVPIAEPGGISAYQDYVKATLDKYNIGAPPPTAATRLLTDDARREMYLKALKTYGAFVTDRDDRGAILVDQFNVPVPNQAGGFVRFDFAAPEKNEEFKAWRIAKTPNALPPGRLQPSREQRFQNMPGLKNDGGGGGEDDIADMKALNLPSPDRWSWQRGKLANTQETVDEYTLDVNGLSDKERRDHIHEAMRRIGEANRQWLNVDVGRDGRWRIQVETKRAGS